MNGKIIGIAGATGSGKTTLVSQLCERYNAIPIYEEWENNPHLVDFYNSKSFFENQIWFIKNDIERMQRAIELCSNKQMIIIDKIFIQNYTFVSITKLSDEEKKLCFELLNNHIHLSNHIYLIINISIAEKEILTRVKCRNRGMELNLNLEWFENFQKYQTNLLKKHQKLFGYKLIEYNNMQMKSEDIIREINK